MPGLFDMFSGSGPTADDVNFNLRSGSDTPDFQARVDRQEAAESKQRGALSAWMKGRDPYYSDLYAGFKSANMAPLMDQYKNALLANRYSQARRGAMEGTADWQSQGRLGQQMAAMAGGVDSQGYGLMQGQRTQDEQQSYALRQLLASNPALAAAYQAEMAASQARAGLGPAQQGAAGMLQQNAALSQGMLSSWLGQTGTTAAALVNNYGSQWGGGGGQAGGGGGQAAGGGSTTFGSSGGQGTFGGVSMQDRR